MIRPLSALKLTAIAFAGASLLTLAACSDEDASANAVVQPDAAAENGATPSGDQATAAGSTGGSDTESATSSSTAAATPAASSDDFVTPSAQVPDSDGSIDVASLMSEQALPDVVQGDPDAPVTIVEYASMTCGHCATFHENSYPAIKQAYLDTGKANMILREFPFDPVSLAAFMLGRCSGDDDRRTAMLDVLFEQQNNWARAENPSEALLRIARMAGMGQDEFVACLNNQELQQQIVDIQRTGQSEYGVEATPTFFINGQKYSGAMAAEDMAAAIEAAVPSD